MSPLLLRINVPQIFTIYDIQALRNFRKISKKTFLVESFQYIIATLNSQRRTLTPVFSGKVFENGWLWMAASEQSETAACNVIWFLTIKISSSNIKFLKITTSEPILVTMRSLEILTQRIFNNLIKQNQKLILFWTSPQQCPVSSV